MAIKFEKIKAGMELWSRGTYRNGLNRSVEGEWPVTILEVDAESRSAKVSWNCNAPTVWNEYQLTRLYTKRKAKKESP